MGVWGGHGVRITWFWLLTACAIFNAPFHTLAQGNPPRRDFAGGPRITASEQRTALLSLRQALGNPPQLAGWTGVGPCIRGRPIWVGITACSEDNLVQAMDLSIVSGARATPRERRPPPPNPRTAPSPSPDGGSPPIASRPDNGAQGIHTRSRSPPSGETDTSSVGSSVGEPIKNESVPPEDAEGPTAPSERGASAPPSGSLDNQPTAEDSTADVPAVDAAENTTFENVDTAQDPSRGPVDSRGPSGPIEESETSSPLGPSPGSTGRGTNVIAGGDTVTQKVENNTRSASVTTESPGSRRTSGIDQRKKDERSAREGDIISKGNSSADSVSTGRARGEGSDVINPKMSEKSVGSVSSEKGNSTVDSEGTGMWSSSSPSPSPSPAYTNPTYAYIPGTMVGGISLVANETRGEEPPVTSSEPGDSGKKANTAGGREINVSPPPSSSAGDPEGKQVNKTGDVASARDTISAGNKRRNKKCPRSGGSQRKQERDPSAAPSPKGSNTGPLDNEQGDASSEATPCDDQVDITIGDWDWLLPYGGALVPSPAAGPDDGSEEGDDMDPATPPAPPPASTDTEIGEAPLESELIAFPEISPEPSILIPSPAPPGEAPSSDGVVGPGQTEDDPAVAPQPETGDSVDQGGDTTGEAPEAQPPMSPSVLDPDPPEVLPPLPDPTLLVNPVNVSVNVSNPGLGGDDPTYQDLPVSGNATATDPSQAGTEPSTSGSSEAGVTGSGGRRGGKNGSADSKGRTAGSGVVDSPAIVSPPSPDSAPVNRTVPVSVEAPKDGRRVTDVRGTDPSPAGTLKAPRNRGVEKDGPVKAACLAAESVSGVDQVGQCRLCSCLDDPTTEECRSEAREKKCVATGNNGGQCVSLLQVLESKKAAELQNASLIFQRNCPKLNDPNADFCSCTSDFDSLECKAGMLRLCNTNAEICGEVFSALNTKGNSRRRFLNRLVVEGSCVPGDTMVVINLVLGELSSESFTSEMREDLVNILAALLGIDPERVNIARLTDTSLTVPNLGTRRLLQGDGVNALVLISAETPEEAMRISNVLRRAMENGGLQQGLGDAGFINVSANLQSPEPVEEPEPAEIRQDVVEEAERRRPASDRPQTLELWGVLLIVFSSVLVGSATISYVVLRYRRGLERENDIEVPPRTESPWPALNTNTNSGTEEYAASPLSPFGPSVLRNMLAPEMQRYPSAPHSPAGRWHGRHHSTPEVMRHTHIIPLGEVAGQSGVSARGGEAQSEEENFTPSSVIPPHPLDDLMSSGSSEGSIADHEALDLAWKRIIREAELLKNNWAWAFDNHLYSGECGSQHSDQVLDEVMAYAL